MRFVRQSAVLGRNTNRRVREVLAVFAATAVDAVAVGAWFVLVALQVRALATALAGLGILVCGCLLRTCVFGAAAGTLDGSIRPDRFGLAVFLAVSWVSWLIVAEAIGGIGGIAAAGLVLAAGLTVQFSLEPMIVGIRRGTADWRSMIAPAVLVAAAASILLASVQLVDWTISPIPIVPGSGAVEVRFVAAHVGGLAFVLGALFAHRWRFRRAVA